MKVIWTPEASETFNSNIDYLIIEYGDQVASDFLNRVDEVVMRIKSNPKIFSSICFSKKRRCENIGTFGFGSKDESFDVVDIVEEIEEDEDEEE